jgi:tetratricopeptide (TPR) repeat protein
MNIQEQLQHALNLHIEGQLSEAKKRYEAVLLLDPQCADAYHLLGCINQHNKNIDLALSQIKLALELSPRNAVFLNSLASLYLEMNCFTDAEHHLSEAIAIDPDYVEAYQNLRIVYFRQQNFEDEIKVLNLLLTKFPQNSDYLADLAVAYGHALKFDLQLDMAKESLSIKNNESAYSSVANALMHLNRHKEALPYINEMIEMDGVNLQDALKMKANFYEISGDLKLACDVYDQAILLGSPTISLLAARIQCSKVSIDHCAVTVLLSLLNNQDELLGLEKTQLFYALGKAYLDNDDIENASKYYALGAKNQSLLFKYDELNNIQMVDEYILGFDQTYFKNIIAHGSQSDRPIFIVGMPRSGTTLIEQILASHPNVFAAGELLHLMEVTNGLQINDCTLSRANNLGIGVHSSLSERAEKYLEKVNEIDGAKEKPFFTDKLPENFINIGLILTLFPNAKIIHCRRDPIDTCISCYVTLFSQLHYWSYDFALLGRMYKRYWSLMNHWRRVLPNRFLEVRYEETVEHPESAARAILEWCGLPWDERVLRFHETDRPVRTASVSQVRQPMYKTSAGRWKKWEPYIQALLNELEPIHQAYWNEIDISKS